MSRVIFSGDPLYPDHGDCPFDTLREFTRVAAQAPASRLRAVQSLAMQQYAFQRKIAKTNTWGSTKAGQVHAALAAFWGNIDQHSA